MRYRPSRHLSYLVFFSASATHISIKLVLLVFFSSKSALLWRARRSTTKGLSLSENLWHWEDLSDLEDVLEPKNCPRGNKARLRRCLWYFAAFLALYTFVWCCCVLSYEVCYTIMVFFLSLFVPWINLFCVYDQIQCTCCFDLCLLYRRSNTA